MLLKFKVSNYKTFVDEVEFSMIPAPKQKDLEYSVLKKEINNKQYKALCSSVIYGPNGSGKTNIIGALETFISIVSKGHIRNEDERSINMSSHNLELIPNCKLDKPKPTKFLIQFIMDNEFVEYVLDIELGLFLDEEFERKVTYEKLTINDSVEFERHGNKINLHNLHDRNAVHDNHLLYVITQNLERNSLFLTNGFKNAINNDLSNRIIDYLKNKFRIFYRSNIVRLRMKLSKENPIVFDDELTRVAKKFDASGNQIYFASNDLENGGNSNLAISIQDHDKKNYLLPVEDFESYGTFRFLNIYPFIKETLKEGGVLVIDEFDASLHPMVIMNIINIFHNDEKNVNNAQLIFNTHNPIFLRNTLFRRDEIKFVEKEDNASIIYSLSDFGTSGKDGVRNTDDYMKNYFINKYGAINDIDLTELFM
jgi:AAA15 family ATPase/GTPase